MQILTIYRPLHRAEDFDSEVNGAIRNGWSLIRREVIVPPTADKNITLYAELAKYEAQEDTALTWRDALQTIKDECENAKECSADGCAMHAWCQMHLGHGADSPSDWDAWSWREEMEEA